MKNILVPTDFSETAGNATHFAVETARLFPAIVTLLHSYEVNSSLITDYVGVNREFTLNMLNDIEKKLDNEKKRIQEAEGVAVDTYISTHALNEAIAKVAQERKSDLIVMGTLGASGIAEKIWGSRTSSVIGDTDVPVMVIPHSYEWKKPRKILFATNQFQRDKKVLNYIFELAGLYMANVEVTVYTDGSDEDTPLFADNKSKILEYGDFLKSNYNENTLTSVHLTGSDFEQTLHNYIEEHDIDMLVMVTYKAGFWRRIFNPSKTKRMSFNTRIPLLAIPVAENAGRHAE